jgi:predicted RNA binding protein YcfA (HicA-like mRNA interferase family)
VQTIGARQDRPAWHRSSEKDSVKVRVIIKLIERDGWRQVGQRGSHRQFEHPTKSGKVTVPGHRNGDVGPEMRANILRQAGLKR